MVKRQKRLKILIGYHQRSGSTLLQHLLNQHSQIKSYSDASSFMVLPGILSGLPLEHNICVKPMDIFYLFNSRKLFAKFNKFIWLARDPRDSYLSALEIKFAYNFWLPGKRKNGIDLGLLQRWRKIYKNYFDNPDSWHLLRYEDLILNTDKTLSSLFQYLELSPESLIPFKPFNILSGGDPKLQNKRRLHSKSLGRFKKQFSDKQEKVFRNVLGDEMRALGYPV